MINSIENGLLNLVPSKVVVTILSKDPLIPAVRYVLNFAPQAPKYRLTMSPGKIVFSSVYLNIVFTDKCFSDFHPTFLIHNYNDKILLISIRLLYFHLLHQTHPSFQEHIFTYFAQSA